MVGRAQLEREIGAAFAGPVSVGAFCCPLCQAGDACTITAMLALRGLADFQYVSVKLTRRAICPALPS